MGGPAVVDARWHRLHPLSPLVRAGRSVYVLLLALLARLLFQRHQDASA